MNMSVSSAPKAVSVAPSSSQAASANGTNGSGFAGALVQAIGGTGAAPTLGNTAMPLGLVGLLGQLGLSESNEQPDDLLAMLAKLMEQLQQLEQEPKLPDGAENPLAALLVVFQGFMQQLGIVQPLSDASVTQSALTSVDSAIAFDTNASQPIVRALRQTLQQLTTALAQSGDLVNPSSALAGELKPFLNALNDLLQKVEAPTTGQANADQAEATAEANRGLKAEAQGNAEPKATEKQTLAATTETKPAAPVLRDPVWKFQVVKASEENVSADSMDANVAPVLSSEQASETGSQPAWTLLNNDLEAAAESAQAQAKASLPAQVPVQQFAQQMDKFLVKQFLITQGNGTSEARLSLTPEHLGQVDIRIVMHNGQLTAQFMTGNAMARDMLENQMAQLRASLNAQGLQVERLEVVQQPSTSSSTSFLNQEHRQNSFGGNGNGNNNRNNDGSYDELIGFEDELERTSTLREIGYGSSLNVTA